MAGFRFRSILLLATLIMAVSGQNISVNTSSSTGSANITNFSSSTVLLNISSSSSTGAANSSVFVTSSSSASGFPVVNVNQNSPIQMFGVFTDNTCTTPFVLDQSWNSLTGLSFDQVYRSSGNVSNVGLANATCLSNPLPAFASGSYLCVDGVDASNNPYKSIVAVEYYNSTVCGRPLTNTSVLAVPDVAYQFVSQSSANPVNGCYQGIIQYRDTQYTGYARWSCQMKQQSNGANNNNGLNVLGVMVALIGAIGMMMAL